MNLTRQELEDIWENKPYGYFSKLLSERKGKKKYIVTTEVRKASIVGTIIQEVWAKDATSAQNIVHSTACNTLRQEHGFNAWEPSLSFTTTAKVA
jgi:predicted N-acyltransferase